MLNMDLDSNFITEKLGDILPTVRRMKAEFEDPELSTFICVCIAEFLSLYETERLIQVIGSPSIRNDHLFRNLQILESTRGILSLTGLCQQQMRIIAKLVKHKQGNRLFLSTRY
jgi:anion-transporting  ArsA/GET3 family ATPase